MMQDRDQKQSALKLSVANRWFPQLEVVVQPTRSVQETAVSVTDLDVFSSMPDQFRGFRTVVFDCKTKAKESPVNRALWLRGVLDRLAADQGICVLKKELMELDHRILAARLGVILLSEDEFELYANATNEGYKSISTNCSDLNLWEEFFNIPKKFPKLGPAVDFLRSDYWMIDDPAEACRKTLATLLSLAPELDPARAEHITVFIDFSALFARSLAVVVCQIFKAYLHPAKQADLSDALLIMLYGGREAYEHRNELYRRVKGQSKESLASGLSLPEWDRFLQLTRQLLDAPVETQKVPLILREVGFGFLRADTAHTFAKALGSESPQGAKFALLVPEYLGKAAKLPPDFAKAAEKVLLALQPIK